MKAATKTTATKKALRAGTTGQFLLRRDDRYEVSQVKNVVAQLKKDPKKGHAMLVQAGIYTHTGKLTKAFGG